MRLGTTTVAEVATMLMTVRMGWKPRRRPGVRRRLDRGQVGLSPLREDLLGGILAGTAQVNEWVVNGTEGGQCVFMHVDWCRNGYVVGFQGTLPHR